MLAVCINGTINAGKSTIGRALAQYLPDAEFVEGDDHGAPDGIGLEAMIDIAIARLADRIARSRNAVLVIAYPLRQEDYVRLRQAAANRGAVFFVVTLAPPQAVVLADRGARTLSEEERSRIREMVAQGYADRPFSDLTIVEMTSPDTVVRTIARSLPGVHRDEPARG